MKTRTAHDNAREFDGIYNSTATAGWLLAERVACSVDPNALPGDKKLTIQAFAKEANVIVPTIRRHYEGWDIVRAMGVDLPAAADLRPEDVGTMTFPEKPFNGPGGYVQTKNQAANGVGTMLEAIITPGPKGPAKIATTLAGSVPALINLVDLATPEVIDDLVSKLSDKKFAALQDSVAKHPKNEPTHSMDRIANDPAALAVLLETASPESLKEALGTVDRKTLRSVAKQSGEERLLQVQEEIIADGGRIPTLEEVNGGPSSDLDGIGSRLSDWSAIASAQNKVFKLLEKYGPVGADGFEAEFLRDSAMKLMDPIVNIPITSEVQQ